jgi:hypothetical protein
MPVNPLQPVPIHIRPFNQSHTRSLANLQTLVVPPGQILPWTTTCIPARSGCSDAWSVSAMAKAGWTRLLQKLWSTFDSVFPDQAGVFRDKIFT